MNKTEGIVNLLINVPDEIKNKILSNYNIEDPTKGDVEIIVLYGIAAEELRPQVEALGGVFEDLGYGFGIITMAAGNILDLAQIRGIDYIELPKNLYLSFEPSNRASCILGPRSIYNLNGEGVLIGFIDSGIDYTNAAFRTESGETRIDYIYDLDANRAVYNKEKIDEALKSNNPYSIVPHMDRVGHGTHVAGIACAGGKIPTRYYGVAPKSSIAMVKMTRQSGETNGKSSQLMRGIKFLIDKAFELNKPLSINISFSTNDGAHNGDSLLEKYIATISTSQRVSISVAAGNEGGRAHHVGGPIEDVNLIQFNVGSQERVLILQMYKSLLNDITLNIISPTGAASNGLNLNKQVNIGTLNNDQYFVYNTGSTPFNIDGEIIIVLSGRGQNFVSSGVWILELLSDGKYNGTYDIWLPIAEGLNEKTRFLNPNINNTVGIPGTVEEVITVGSYNFNNLTISLFSGRGNIKLDPVKPDLVAPGEDIESATLGGGFEPLSGTSMATPAAAGAAGLLMEFGILQGRDPYLYGERLKYFLLKGAERNRVDVEYPNNSWGYGTLCLEGAIKVWQNESNK